MAAVATSWRVYNTASKRRFPVGARHDKAQRRRLGRYWHREAWPPEEDSFGHQASEGYLEWKSSALHKFLLSTVNWSSADNCHWADVLSGRKETRQASWMQTNWNLNFICSRPMRNNSTICHQKPHSSIREWFPNTIQCKATLIRKRFKHTINTTQQWFRRWSVDADFSLIFNYKD